MVLRALLELVELVELRVLLGAQEPRELRVLLEQKPPTTRLLRIRLVKLIIQIRTM